MRGVYSIGPGLFEPEEMVFVGFYYDNRNDPFILSRVGPGIPPAIPPAPFTPLIYWAMIGGRSGAQNSVPLYEDETYDTLEGQVVSSPLPLGYGPELTTKEYLYNVYVDASRVIKATRMPWGEGVSEEDIEEIELGESIHTSSFRFAVRPSEEGDVLFINIGAGPIFAWVWGESAPRWSVDLPASNEVWGPVLSEDMLSLILYPPGSDAGYGIVLDVNSGEKLWESVLPWEDLGDPPEIEGGRGLPSITAHLEELHRHSMWRTYPLQLSTSTTVAPFIRGGLLLNKKLVPLSGAHNQVLCIDVLNPAGSWVMHDYNDFDPDLLDEEQIEERYTVVGGHEDRLLVFFQKIGSILKTAFYEHSELSNDPNEIIWFNEGQFDQIDYDSRTADFGERSPNIVYGSLSTAPDTISFRFTGNQAGTELSDLLAEKVAIIENPENGWKPDEDEVDTLRYNTLIDYGYHILNLVNGHILNTRLVSDLDGWIADNERDEDSKPELLEIPVGYPETVSRIAIYEKEPYEDFDWDTLYNGEERDTDEAEWWPPLAEGKVRKRRWMYVLYEGFALVPDVPPGLGPAHGDTWRYPYPAGTDIREIYFSIFRANFGHSPESYPVQGRDYGWIKSLSDPRPSFYWYHLTTKMYVVTICHDYDAEPEHMRAAGMPRWDAVQGAYVDGKWVFGPGIRNKGEERGIEV